MNIAPSTPSLTSSCKDDVRLAKQAAEGNVAAREAVSRLAHPLIQSQTNRFCKRFCFKNHVYSRCTLDANRGLHAEDIPFCDWGNHSYAWMLEDLSGAKRLQTFSGKDGAKLSTYFYTIVHSLPFYERWKNFRFGRRIRIPEYIQKISPMAGKIFLWMVDQHPIAFMAQKTRQSEAATSELAGEIISELTERGKLHLLNTPKILSLTGQGTDDDPESEGMVGDVVDDSWDPAEEQTRDLMREGLKKLTAVERFILETMVIENREASDVLKGLVRAGISIKKGTPPEKLDRQQLFYFKRKTLVKLKQILKLEA